MAQQTISVHQSKLTYATLKKMLSLVDSYLDIKNNLTFYFPNIISDNDQWKILKDTCITFLENNKIWTGTSPSTNANDFTEMKIPHQLNTDSVIHLYNRLLGQVDFVESNVVNLETSDTWNNILTRITDMVNLEKEYTMHRQLFNAVKDEDAFIDKEPGQIALYEDCEMPLPSNNNTPDNANYHSFYHILGADNYHTYLPVYGIDYVANNITKRFKFRTSKVTISGSPYTHTATIGCILQAVDSAGNSLTTTTYDDHDTVNISGADNGTVLRILELYEEVEEEGIDTIILSPETVSPSGGIQIFTPLTLWSSSFEVSGGYFDLHEYSSWQIASDSSFTTIVWESIEDRNNLTSLTFDPSSYLDISTTYYWRVLHSGANYGESDWSEHAYFETPSTWSCSVGESAGGGIMAGSVNNNCIIVTGFDGEPTGSNEFFIKSTDSETLEASGQGDLVYRSDEDSYYINKTGGNSSMDDFTKITPKPEPNYDMYVDSESEQLSLSVNEGYIAIRTDQNICYVNITGSNSSMSDWLEVDTPVMIWWVAKQYCLNLSYGGYSDWYMPTASELNLIYNNISTIDSNDGTGSFNSWIYWSSTVDIFNDKYNAWTQNFNTGNQNTEDRDTKWFYIRPVRRLGQ